MADISIIDQCLGIWAANFNKTDSWKNTVRSVWHSALMEINDKVLYDCTMKICTQSFAFPPQLGQLIQEIEKAIKEQGGTGTTIKNYSFCSNCEAREGIINTVAHYAQEDGTIKASARMCRCTCEGGKRKYGRSLMTARERYNAIKSHQPPVEMIEFFWTSQDMPTFPLEVTDPEFAKQLKAKREAGELKNNPFSKLAAAYFE